MQLDQLLATRADLWRGHATPAAAPTGLATGFAALDAALAGHGWPAGGLSEVLTAHQGAGLALLLPLLAALSRQPRWLLWVDPPHLPYAPALAAAGLDLRRILIVRAGADGAWAAEQGLGSGTCAAVLAWTAPAAPTGRARGRPAACWTPAALRRLQLAAAEHRLPALLLRPPAAAGETSPAALRLKVGARDDGLEVTLLKQRGGRPGQRLWLPARADAEPAAAGRADAVETPARAPAAEAGSAVQVGDAARGLVVPEGRANAGSGAAARIDGAAPSCPAVAAPAPRPAATRRAPDARAASQGEPPRPPRLDVDAPEGAAGPAADRQDAARPAPAPTPAQRDDTRLVAVGGAGALAARGSPGRRRRGPPRR
jgi:hypothetical protein